MIWHPVKGEEAGEGTDWEVHFGEENERVALSHGESECRGKVRGNEGEDERVRVDVRERARILLRLGAERPTIKTRTDMRE